jgi:CelD/BcsL family acetyltransferase involved in cellulose biosynthesis
MLITEVTTTEAFDRLRSEWNALIRRLDSPSPFQSWEWNRIWWKHFGTGHRLRILTFREAGELRGIAQLHERRYGPRWIARSVIAPLGWEDHRRRQGLTEQNELIFPAADASILLAALSDWLDTQRWSVVLLPAMQSPSRLPAQLAKRVVLVGKPNWFYHRPLPPAWPEFVNGLGKSMRDNVKYYPKLLERRGHQYRFPVYDAPRDIPAALDVFFALHRARANATSSSIKHRDKFAFKDRRSFLREVAPAMAALGQLRVGLLEVDGAPVAAQIWLEMGETLYIYYTGFDPDWSKFSVQLVATLKCLQDGMARGMRQVEFLRGGDDGNDQRNERWGTSKRVLVNVTLARRPALTKLVLGVPRVQRALRLGGATVARDRFTWRPAR